ncbi:hypothetical protein [Alkaliphilus oremlandii]|nr:hypothetical protein [Alkaliphilus oremlandii]
MVMWMSRIENKKREKKIKRYMRMGVTMTVILLIFGVLAVDFRIRKSLAIEEVSLIDYKHLKEYQYLVHIMGKNYVLDFSELSGALNNKFAEFREIAYNIKRYATDFLKR